MKSKTFRCMVVYAIVPTSLTGRGRRMRYEVLFQIVRDWYLNDYRGIRGIYNAVGCSTRTGDRILDELERINLITCIRRGRYRRRCRPTVAGFFTLVSNDEYRERVLALGLREDVVKLIRIAGLFDYNYDKLRGLMNMYHSFYNSILLNNLPHVPYDLINIIKLFNTLTKNDAKYADIDSILPAINTLYNMIQCLTESLRR